MKRPIDTYLFLVSLCILFTAGAVSAANDFLNRPTVAPRSSSQPSSPSSSLRPSRASIPSTRRSATRSGGAATSRVRCKRHCWLRQRRTRWPSPMRLSIRLQSPSP